MLCTVSAVVDGVAWYLNGDSKLYVSTTPQVYTYENSILSVVGTHKYLDHEMFFSEDLVPYKFTTIKLLDRRMRKVNPGLEPNFYGNQPYFEMVIQPVNL